MPNLISGQPVRLSLTDVQGLWAVMLSLVKTIDAELGTTKAGEVALRKRWKARHPYKMLSAIPHDEPPNYVV